MFITFAFPYLSSISSFLVAVSVFIIACIHSLFLFYLLPLSLPDCPFSLFPVFFCLVSSPFSFRSLRFSFSFTFLFFPFSFLFVDVQFCLPFFVLSVSVYLDFLIPPLLLFFPFLLLLSALVVLRTLTMAPFFLCSFFLCHFVIFCCFFYFLSCSFYFAFLCVFLVLRMYGLPFFCLCFLLIPDLVLSYFYLLILTFFLYFNLLLLRSLSRCFCWFSLCPTMLCSASLLFLLLFSVLSLSLFWFVMLSVPVQYFPFLLSSYVFFPLHLHCCLLFRF